MNILTRIKTEIRFSPNEQELANYILEHPEEVIKMSADQLAKKNYVSTATVYRLCDKLGVDGFGDLRLCITENLKEFQKEDDSFNFDFPVSEDASAEEALRSIQEDYEKTVAATLNLFQVEDLKKAVKDMKKAKYIDVYTSAGNIYFAQNFAFQMLEIGNYVNVPLEEHHQRLTASQSNEEHFAIVISFAGRGSMAEQVRRILKNNGTKTLLICSSEYDYGEILPDYKLFISPHENHFYKVSSFSTRLSVLYILDVLYTCYFKEDYEKNMKYKLYYFEQMKHAYDGIEE